jgi:hypothetical protein
MGQQVQNNSELTERPHPPMLIKIPVSNHIGSPLEFRHQKISSEFSMVMFQKSKPTNRVPLPLFLNSQNISNISMAIEILCQITFRYHETPYKLQCITAPKKNLNNIH